MRLWRQGERTPVWWSAAALAPALFALDLYGHIQHGATDWKTWFFLATMGLGLGIGLWIWAWRPLTHMGPLLYWWPALTLAGDLMVAYPDSRSAATIGLALYTMGLIVFAQMALSYPNGKLMRGLAASFYIFVAGYAAQVIQNAYNLAVVDGRGCPFCPPPHERSWLFVGGPPFSLDWWNRGWAIEIIAVLPIGLTLLWLKLFRLPPGGRRTFLPLVLGGTVTTCFAWVILFLIVIDDRAALVSVSSYDWIDTAGQLAALLGAFVGLAATRRARGPVGNLVVELGRARPGLVRAALARALGDPSLELALWLPERDVWVDEQGDEVTLSPGRGPRGHLRRRGPGGDRPRPGLPRPACTARGRRLRGAPRARERAAAGGAARAARRAARARVRGSSRAGDEERRRLERDLHDGAQQRLLGIGMALQLLRDRGDRRRRALLDETEAEVEAALDELRELARGIHPAVLTDQGLARGARTLAERSPVPVERRRRTRAGCPAQSRRAVYFIVAEALANVAKHAQRVEGAGQGRAGERRRAGRGQRRRRRRRRPRAAPACGASPTASGRSTAG